ncbi:Sec-independent protein translocase protein tatA [Granulibacter bethesdensis]|uniref:Sec-independent protein translocase protein TatA n=2 Tax=Granulibacter bethesdensis TaxID=364410 RepID=A0AAN0RFY2_9PROT|nr:Sec-independent protein translocase protein tatA [Granulibacter bethesdensis]AHJ65244.1 Sec-independent protein translocase protein tatA [Granulibacter bethesdensis CGDNIH4]
MAPVNGLRYRHVRAISCLVTGSRLGEIMGSLSIWHWLILLAVVAILFGGGGKISGLMGDLGKGIKSFKRSMAEEDDASMEHDPKNPAVPPPSPNTSLGNQQPAQHDTTPRPQSHV